MFQDDVDLAKGIWSAIRSALESMVVSRVQKKGMNEIRKSCRLNGETNLAFLMRMHLLFQAVNRHQEEVEVFLIVYDRLTMKWQDKILEAFPVETSSFPNLIDFFKARKKQEEYKGSAGLRLSSNQKSASTSQVPLNLRPMRSSSSDVYGKRNEGKIRCSVHQGWGHARHECRKCSRCGKYGHLAHLH